MLVELAPDIALAVFYLLACLSAFTIRAKLSGSTVAKRFTAMGIAWLLGLLSVGARMAIWYYRPPRIYVPELALRSLGIMAIHVPMLVVALSLLSLAILYSRYT